ncbi:MAG: NfeD family protein [Actinomycetota bacterium]
MHSHAHPRRDLAVRPCADRDSGSDRLHIALVVAILLAVFWLPTSWGIAVVVGGLVVELGEAALWIRLSRRLRPAVGMEALIGQEGIAATDCRPQGSVRVNGELWGAVCADGVVVGEQVVVESVTGLTLRVRPK